MARRRILIAAAAAACACRLRPAAFEPALARQGPAAAAAAAVVSAAVPSASVDKIDGAAVKLSSEAYPCLKEGNGNNDYFASVSGAKPDAEAKAIARVLEMGAAMDGAAVKAGVIAREDAIGAVDKDGVTAQAAFQQIDAALGSMFASAGEEKTLDVYGAWKDVIPAEAPAYLRRPVDGKDVEQVYKEPMECKDVVEPEPGTGAAAPAVRAPEAIDAAAKTLLEAAYPCMKEVDWNADHCSKVPGVKPAAALGAVKKALVRGDATDAACLEEEAMTRARTIGDVNAQGVLPLDDFIAINLAIGHMIESPGEGIILSPFTAFKGLVLDNFPSCQMSTVNGVDV